MRDYSKETEKRVEFIKNTVAAAGANGVIFGNSGGKDSALVGILCKMAVDTVGVIMPCTTKRNYNEDKTDGEEVAAKFNIETRVVDLTKIKESFIDNISDCVNLSDTAKINIAPRLRMMTLYSIAASENRLVAGTGNRSEIYMGYFTKHGDGACDFNPIADLTVTEIFEFLRYLKAPESIINKAPSAALADNQTDEGEMKITYEKIDRFLTTGEADESDKALIERFHSVSEHKRNGMITLK